MNAKQEIRKLLKIVDIEIGGKRDHDIQVHDDRLYTRVMTQGNLGLGESYMDGWWSCRRIDKMLTRILESRLDKRFKLTPRMLFLYLRSKIANMQRLRAHNIGEKHYDIGNGLYKKMLDRNMQYSCGYWKDARTLEQAQKAKMDLICRKLELKKGESLLDIGCGWGGLLRYAAENYGIRGMGITVSREQAKHAWENTRHLPVEIKVIDYRKYKVKFDKVVSVGMVEHVGPKNYRTFMRTAYNNLKDEGLFLLHTIGTAKSSRTGDPWIDKYIFPDGVLPSVTQLSKYAEGRFVVEDLHNFGFYYDNTLMAWYRNFCKAWPLEGYDERFRRMWEYYLLSCAATFRAGRNHLWQFVLSKDRKKIYHASR